MKTLFATAAAALLATTATAALAGNVVPAAADPVVVTPAPVATAYDFSGIYGGASVGWMSGETVGVDDFDGLAYGGFLGYNYQFASGLVVGAEAAVSMGQPEWTGGATLDATFIDLKARVGFAADRALIYAFGGYTIADFSNNDEGAGFNAGAGIEYLVTDNIFVGVEYIFRDIEDTVASPAAWEDKFGTIQARVGFTF